MRSNKTRGPTLQVHPAVAALMAEALPGEKAEDVIIRKCRRMVSFAKSKGWVGPPFDPKILAGLFKIKVEAASDGIDGDGCIFPRNGRLVIQYRPGRTEERQRFTICHELAHTCFPNQFSSTHYHNGTAYDEAFRKFELLCDRGAAELLMPHEEFHADIVGSPASIKKGTELATRYKASFDATIRRILDLHTTASCAAVFLTTRNVGNERTPEGRLRALYCWKSRGFSGYIPSGTLLPVNSVAWGPNRASLTSVTKETWWIGGRPRSFYVEAHDLPPVPENPEYPSVVVLIHSRKPTELRDILSPGI